MTDEKRIMSDAEVERIMKEWHKMVDDFFRRNEVSLPLAQILLIEGLKNTIPLVADLHNATIDNGPGWT